MMQLLRTHARIALFNLLLVAFAGLLLRYKISFSLPWLNQKFLLHGHSHFAFAGWISHALMVLFLHLLLKGATLHLARHYRWILNANLLTAYGMLISFPLQGYGLPSIVFSTANILVLYFFTYFIWKDCRSLPVNNSSRYWIKAALLFNVVSSLGAFSLALMMATKTAHPHFYLAAVYFFLHFQYNGWFFFGCMAIVFAVFLPFVAYQRQQTIFWLFFSACVPAYLLSALWLPMPVWLYVLVIVAAVAQLAGWLLTLQTAREHWSLYNRLINPYIRYILLMVSVALSIKLLLQLGSTIPSLSTLAFGFRPIVIGYLHLVLLAVTSMFLLAAMRKARLLQLNQLTVTGTCIFVLGILLNELLLMLQGVAGLAGWAIPMINTGLLLAAVVLFSGILILNAGQRNASMINRVK